MEAISGQRIEVCHRKALWMPEEGVSRPREDLTWQNMPGLFRLFDRCWGQYDQHEEGRMDKEDRRPGELGQS